MDRKVLAWDRTILFFLLLSGFVYALTLCVVCGVPQFRVVDKIFLKNLEGVIRVKSQQIAAATGIRLRKETEERNACMLSKIFYQPVWCAPRSCVVLPPFPELLTLALVVAPQTWLTGVSAEAPKRNTCSTRPMNMLWVRTNKPQFLKTK